MTVDNTLGIDDLVDVELLGSGGFSVVYSATHALFDRRVAVKVLTSIATDTDRRRFEQECRAMGRLTSNPNVVTVYQAGYTTSNRPYLIMELIQGGSLADLLAQVGRLSWEEAVDIVLPVCSAVGHAHRQGILHRDIKPDNILLDNGVPKLADFGIASLRDARGGAGAGASTQVSASWFHTPPETFHQARDERSDLYALASTLYTAVDGHPPMWNEGDDSVYPLVQRLMTDDPPPLPPGLAPPELNRFLQRLLARNPDRRLQTAEEFAAELAAIRGVAPPPLGPTTAATPPGDQTRPVGGLLSPGSSPTSSSPDAGIGDRHEPTSVLPVADAPGQPGGGATATQVLEDDIREVARAARARAQATPVARDTGDLDPSAWQGPPPRSGWTTTLLVVGVVVLAVISAAATWLVLNRAGSNTAASGSDTSSVAGADSEGADGAPGGSLPADGADSTTTTTIPDADADGVPDVDDACPDQAGVDSGGGCPDTDGDTVPDADDACPLDPGLNIDAGCPMDQITIELVRFHVVRDCDTGLFSGDGEFTFQATTVHNATGPEEELINFGDTYELSDGGEVAIGESATVLIPHQPGKELRVEFLSEEEDGFPDPPRDEGLGPGGMGATSNRHQWARPDGWTNLTQSGMYTLVNGSDPDTCQVELDYRLTITTVEPPAPSSTTAENLE